MAAAIVALFCEKKNIKHIIAYKYRSGRGAKDDNGKDNRAIRCH